MNPFLRSAGTDATSSAFAGPYAQQAVIGAILAFKAMLDWMVLDEG